MKNTWKTIAISGIFVLIKLDVCASTRPNLPKYSISGTSTFYVIKKKRHSVQAPGQIHLQMTLVDPPSSWNCPFELLVQHSTGCCMVSPAGTSPHQHDHLTGGRRLLGGLTNVLQNLLSLVMKTFGLFNEQQLGWLDHELCCLEWEMLYRGDQVTWRGPCYGGQAGVAGLVELPGSASLHARQVQEGQ